MNTLQSGDKKLVIIKKTKQEESKTFTSFTELKQHLKTVGFDEKEIQEFEQKWNRGGKEIVFNKTSPKIDLDIGINNKTPPSQSNCSRCKKPLQSGDRQCRYCGAPVKIPLWKRMLGLE